jgi:N-acetylmuramoyl-L-alanine amidase
MIIVHHTGGPTIGSAISTFLSPSDVVSSHYLIDTDGQILKMVQDKSVANQAGQAFWAGVKNVNAISVGIEIVNATASYPKAQYRALLDLLDRIQKAFPMIDDENIVGHSDIATDDKGVLGRKSSDPGSLFEWAQLEDAGLGLQLTGNASPVTIYSGIFGAFPGIGLKRGDNDKKQIFGGHKRADFKGTPIQELQSDLASIGYSIGTPDGDYGHKSQAAVSMFQEHFFAGGRGHKAVDGVVDFATAQLVKQAI